MELTELIDWCEKYNEGHDYIIFTDEIFNDLNEEKAKAVAKLFGHNTLMKLPEKEIKFFKWLKQKDKKIWDDLWIADEEPYIVSVNFLPLLIDNTRGFPICDLLNNDNYYFTKSHMVDKESELLIESVQKMYMDKQALTVEQTLVLEISLMPVDIWRFSYRYNIDLDRAKKAVSNLVEEGILVHLKDAEHLAIFIEL